MLLETTLPENTIRENGPKTPPLEKRVVGNAINVSDYVRNLQHPL